MKNQNINSHIDDGSMGGGGPITHDSTLTVGEAGNIYNNHFLPSNRQGIFYYCIIGHELNPSASGWKWRNDGFALAGHLLGTIELASTFMHELGHCLDIGDNDIDLDGDRNLDSNEDDDSDGSWENYCEDSNCAMIDYGWPVNYCTHHWGQMNLLTITTDSYWPQPG